MRLRDFVKLARPRDWLKNVFVLMPVPFALAAGGHLHPVSFLLGVAALSLASSAVYALNDALDAERDRLHEKKRERPIAAGRVSKTEALVFAGALLVAGFGLAALSGARVALLVIAAYVAKELLYQLGLKHVPLVDVFLLSSGFVLRVVLGAELVGTAPSNWLLLVLVDAGALHLAREAARRARARHGRRAPARALGLHRAVPRPGAGGDGRDDPDRLRALLHGREGAAGRAASSPRCRSSCSACSSTCASRRCAARAARRSTSCSPRRRWSSAASAGRSRHSGVSGSPESLVVRGRRGLPLQHAEVLARVVDQDLVARGQPRLAHEDRRAGPVGDEVASTGAPRLRAAVTARRGSAVRSWKKPSAPVCVRADPHVVGHVRVDPAHAVELRAARRRCA